MSVLDDIVDWFTKAKEAKKEKQKLPDLGNTGKMSSPNAYKEAQQALAENDNEE